MIDVILSCPFVRQRRRKKDRKNVRVTEEEFKEIKAMFVS